MGRVSLEPTAIAGLWRTRTQRHADARGAFGRVYCRAEFAALGLPVEFAQINFSVSEGAGTLRGLHYQADPKPDGKYVRCLEGRVYDVAVDLRRGSPTFLRWQAFELDGERGDALYLPPGFAHGFQVLSEAARLVYLHTAAWDPNLDRGLCYDDPRLGIDWPLPVGNLSPRDQAHPPLSADFAGVSV